MGLIFINGVWFCVVWVVIKSGQKSHWIPVYAGLTVYGWLLPLNVSLRVATPRGNLIELARLIEIAAVVPPSQLLFIISLGARFSVHVK